MHPALQPLDEFNLELERQVHPRDWVNPSPAERYNLVVLGGGTAGLISAIGAAGLGARVALIERDLLGGDCLNVGCVPSKALLHSARVAATVRRSAASGVDVPAGVHCDFPRIMQRLRRLRAAISPNDSAARYRDRGIDVFLGEGRFTGPQTVEVAGATLKFQKGVIATGARASQPAIPGLAEAGCLTNERVFSLTELPQRLAILGGGPIGCELAQAFARLGSRVTVIDTNPQVLSREEPEAADVVGRALALDGVEFRLSATVTAVVRDGAAKVLLVQNSTGEERLTVDEILVAAGRTPNVEGLGLESAGITSDPREGIEVNDHLQTTNRRVYAAGDVCSRFRFTHAADGMARVVIQNALFWGRQKWSARTIPWCTYTEPELARVGLSAREAAREGVEIETFRQEFQHVDRAILEEETAGLAIVHVRRGSDRIVGATVVGPHAGELISEVTLAMSNGLGLKAIGRTIHPYPTRSDILRRTADAWNRTRLTPRVQWLLNRWLEWTR